MTDQDKLHHLAALAGVGTAYRDAWGEMRTVATETLIAVLNTLGIAAATPGEIAESLALLAAEPWQTLLPPVVVMHAPAPPIVPLTAPARLMGSRIEWLIACEDGTLHAGAVAAAALPVLAMDERSACRRLALALPHDLALGHHRLQVKAGTAAAETVLILTPAGCFLPKVLAAGGCDWGLTVQLHSLRSARNWGMGDFTDLSRIAALAARRGAQALGVNPLHALFPAEPRHISPYSPSSRIFLNPLYLDVEAVLDFADCAAARARMAAPAFQIALDQARAAKEIDHTAVAGLKQPIFAALYQTFAARHLGGEGGAALSARGAAFRRFQQEAGPSLAAYAVFNALDAAARAAGQGPAWRNWEPALRDVRSAAVNAFAETHRAAVEQHQYLEWEADRQLSAAASAGQSAGLGLGLYRDLAVGVDPNGADAWTNPGVLAAGATVGAPPDQLNLKGQDWGFAPPHPMALRRQAYAPFIAALRANMRHAGVLRLDHVMALKQLYCVPQGASPAAGAYVAYPFEDLLGILALESTRQRCAVIGEDLGTVPEGFRERLGEARVLSYRVLLFEKGAGGRFHPPAAYPAGAAATVATHDLPTLKGFWLGRDLEWRRALGLYPDEAAAEADRQGRAEDRRRLLEALIEEGVLDPALRPALLPEDAAPVFTAALAEAVHRFLGRSRAVLTLLQIEDAVGELEQANLPGTVDGHPNWRRRLGCGLEDIAQDEGFLRITAALDGARKSGR